MAPPVDYLNARDTPCPRAPRRSCLRKPTGLRRQMRLIVLADLASEVSWSKKRPCKVNISYADGFWRPDFAGASHCVQDHCSSEERLYRQVLLHLVVNLSPRPVRPTDDSQEHINIGRRRIASGWWYRPARHAWASRNGRSESPGLLTVI